MDFPIIYTFCLYGEKAKRGREESVYNQNEKKRTKGKVQISRIPYGLIRTQNPNSTRSKKISPNPDPGFLQNL